MVGMKKILFATDGSNSANKAAEMVMKFMRVWPDLQLEVIYVTSRATYAYDFAPDVVDNYEESIASEIEHDVRTELFKEWNDRVRFEHLVGHPITEICDYAKNHESDLIVLGSHGRGAIDRLLIGSVSRGVMHRTNTPVLIAKG
jgi:nucleotide-binding universal stress UspA family protein